MTSDVLQWSSVPYPTGSSTTSGIPFVRRMLMRVVKAIALGIGLSFLGVAGNASADSLIINGSFEQGSFIGGSFGWPLAQQIIGPDSTTLPGWTVTGEVAWFASGFSGIAVSNGTYALDLTGFCDLSCGTPYGGVQQTVLTTPGTTYTLSFLAGNYPYNTSQPTMVVNIEGNPYSFTLPSTTSASGVWDSETITFIATTASTLISFTGSGGAEGSTYYLGLDNVSLSDPLSPVPLPSALPLFATGLAGLGLLGWRRKKKIGTVSA